MYWLQTVDTGFFHLINGSLSNPVLDVAMPLASGHPVFVPLAVVAAIVLIWKQRTRGALCLLMTALSVGIVDGVLCRTIKQAVGRPRPYVSLAGVRRPAEKPRAIDAGTRDGGTREVMNRPFRGGGDFASMPSSHAANMFAVTMVFFIYYRRTATFMLPLAVVVSASRVYNGVHYPSDVLTGAVFGAGGAVATIWTSNRIWLWAGQKWFPLWWSKLPSLIAPSTPTEGEEREPPPRPPRADKLRGVGAPTTPAAALDAHWLRLGYLLIGLLLVVGLGYAASGTIQLSEDEAYHWLWSKRLALSYYGAPPLIAYVQFLGTSLWGDTVFGVRFLAPVIAALVSLAWLRFFTRVVNGRAGFFLLLIIHTTPLLAAAMTLMTVDLLAVMFWTLAMLAGWQALQLKGTTRDWLRVGLWMGLGFLSDYAQLFQPICWAVFFALWPPARRHLRRPGPWLALAIIAVCASPLLIWNQAHGWPSLRQVAEHGDARKGWTPSLTCFVEFLGGEAGLLNPIYFVGIIWAAVTFLRTNRHDPRLVYFFTMGAPPVLACLIWTVYSRALPIWTAPAIFPLLCLMVAYWDARWRLGVQAIKPWLSAGLGLGLLTVVTMHDTDLVERVTRHSLPANLDPLRSVRGWDQTAKAVGAARGELLKEGKDAFIIAADHGLAAQISFWLPEAKAGLPDAPLVYCQRSPEPQNQFHFWPSYEMRKGENAIFVNELNPDQQFPGHLPDQLVSDFQSVTVVGVSNVMYHQRLLRPLQIAFCRGLK